MKICKYFISIAFSVLRGCASSSRTMRMETGQHPHMFTGPGGTTSTGYLLFLPKGYNESRDAWPLILFLHGSGEAGTDLEIVKRNGPPSIAEHDSTFPFIVLSPQCPSSERWSPAQLEPLLDEIIRHYRVDTDRVYLTGLSMGGYGTWDYATLHPDRFAAIAPVCGGGDPFAVCALRNVPAWVFQGARDNTVPIENADEMVTCLKACGGDVRYTVYPQTGHNAWDEAYATKELYTWLLSHRRSTNLH
jgi:predicted peptidase